jgi:single-stranded DNA-binding protein
MWRKTDNISPFLKKGKHVLVKGEPSARAYLSKEGLEPKGVLHCFVEEFEFLDKAPVN